MRLRIEFGIKGAIREVNWWKPIEDFPTIVKHNGVNWSWFMYEADLSGNVDWILRYSQIPSYDAESRFIAPTLDEIVGASVDNSCQCGAIYTSFPNHHMFFCPQWSKL